MKDIKLEKFDKEALNLFTEAKTAFENSHNEKLRLKSEFVPTRFVDENKKVRIVFAGQYSAGKSSILSILTGQQLEVGQGVTTSECQFLDWNGIEVVDTPGIHTQKRPDHDEITYQAMSEADLIVFVCTAEGFSRNLGQHFRKLLIEKGKGNEMLLVLNKMESTEYGNTPEGRKELLEHDILPVISPEFKAEDLYISYIDTYAYQDAQTEKDPEQKKYLLEISGYEDFYENLNRFIDNKKVLGKCTTSLYKLEQMLSDALTEFKSGDFCADGSIELLNQQRKMLSEAKTDIQTKAYDIVRQKTQKVRQWGDEIANDLRSSDNEEEVNKKLKDKYEKVGDIFTEAAEEIEKIIELKNEELKKAIEKLSTSAFAQSVKSAIEDKIKNIKISQQSSDKWKNRAENVKNAGEWLSKIATGNNAKSGWDAIFKLGTYSGSNAHQTILQVGHFVGHKFKPWEAVKLSSKVGQLGKILGVGGALVCVALQFYDDAQQKEAELQLISYRSDIRNTFTAAANTIDLQFDEDTQMWVEKNLNPTIQQIDDQITEIEDSVSNQENEFNTYHDLLRRTRELIKEIQEQ